MVSTSTHHHTQTQNQNNPQSDGTKEMKSLSVEEVAKVRFWRCFWGVGLQYLARSVFFFFFSLRFRLPIEIEIAD
jgi:hypothetical protein